MRPSILIGVLITLIALVAFEGTAGSADNDGSYGATEQVLTLDAPSVERFLIFAQPDQEPRLQSTPLIKVAQCCKICTTGKACGNSCISRKYTCRKPPGCACDG